MRAVSELSERLNTPVSTDELERRWAEVRAVMEAQDIDVLVLQNNSDSCGGYVRWFTDMPASYYPTTAVFPRDRGMSVVSHGALGEVRELAGQTDGVWRGVEKVFSTASFPSAPYMREYDAELALRGLEPFARATVGLVGTAQMSLAFGECLRRGLPNARFLEASELVDRIKAIKSEEEQSLIRSRPGRRKATSPPWPAGARRSSAARPGSTWPARGRRERRRPPGRGTIRTACSSRATCSRC